MIRVIIFSIMVALFFFVDQQLNSPFLLSEMITGSCDGDNCAYCVDTTQKQVTFVITPSVVDSEQAVYTRILKHKYNCSEVVETTDKDHFPHAGYNIETNTMLSEVGFKIEQYGYKNGSSTYIEVDVDTKTYGYALLITKTQASTINMFYKNKLKYLEDSFVTFVAFVMFMITLKTIPEEQHGLGKYLEEHQITLIFTIALLSQPLRPLCFLNNFETVEWLLGQGSYSLGECIFLIYFLQILSFMRGSKSYSRNIALSVFVIVPIAFDRFLIAFTSYSRVLVNLKEQIPEIEIVMQVCWWCFIAYSGVFLYEIFMILQSKRKCNQLFNSEMLHVLIIDVLFFTVYAVQKSHFYLYYENYSHHLFNPVNMLLMILYLSLIITQKYSSTEQQYICKSRTQEYELEQKHLHLEDEDENNDEKIQISRLDQEIAEYYHSKDVLI